MTTANMRKVRAVGVLELIPAAGYAYAAAALLTTDILSGGISTVFGIIFGVCSALKFFSAGRKLCDPDYFNRSFKASPAILNWGMLAPLYHTWSHGLQTRGAKDAANTPAVS